MSAFFGIRWEPARTEARARARVRAARLVKAGFEIVLEWRGILILSRPDNWNEPSIVLRGGSGFIFGVLFAQTEARVSERVRSIDRDLDAIIAAGGERFCRDYWGSYVAVLVERAHDNVKIIRDPMGGRACYYADEEDLRYFCSHVEDLARVCRCSPDPERSVAFLGHAHLVTRETGLKGVSELLAGEQLTLTRTAAQLEQVWRPPQADPHMDDVDALARAAAEKAQMVAGAWAGVKSRVVHRLSGGLDSSVVLALLARARGDAELVCINERSRAAPEGDESGYARLAADACGARVEEIWIDPGAVDYRNLDAAPAMASPSMSLLSFAHDPYPSVDNALLTSGQGGDQVFFRSRSPLIAADALRAMPPPEWGRAIYDTARMSGLSFWRVARIAFAHGLFRRLISAEEFFEPGAPLGGSDALSRAVRAQMHHAWLKGWERAPPAFVKRVLAVLDGAQYFWLNGLSSKYASYPVFLSQPLVEHLLSVPSLSLIHGGDPRGFFRLAFRGLIPDVLLWRVGKGQTTRHFAEVLRCNRDVIVETVCDGELLKLGLFDRAAVSAMTARREITESSQVEDWLKAFVAERWYQRWAELEAAFDPAFEA